MDKKKAEPSSRDFDFWMGRWSVHNRRLRKRLAGADEWDEFEATVVARPILGGMANEDEFRTDYDGGTDRGRFSPPHEPRSHLRRARLLRSRNKSAAVTSR